jgi:hypothetical protein
MLVFVSDNQSGDRVKRVSSALSARGHGVGGPVQLGVKIGGEDGRYISDEMPVGADSEERY